MLWRTCSVALLRFQTRVGGNEGTKGEKGDEVRSTCASKSELQVLSPIPHCPPASQNEYELFDIGHFPGSMYAVAFVSAPRTCHSGLRVHGYGGSPPAQRDL